MILNNLIKMLSNFISFNSIRNYGQLIWTIFGELFTASMKQVIGIIILSWCSVSALTTSFAGFFVLINEWIKKDGLSLGPWTLYFHNDISFTFFAATFLLVLGILGAWCSYYIETVIARTAIQYYQKCSLRFLKQIHHPENDGWQGFFCSGLKKELSCMINSDLRRRGMIGKHLLQGILPGFTCIVAGSIMVYTDWKLSVSVVALSLFFLPYFFKINQSTAAMQREYERLGQIYRSRFSELLKDSLLNGKDYSSKALSDFVSGDFFFQQKFMFLKRFNQGHKIQALNSTFFAIFLYMLILFFLLSVSNGGVAWQKLLVFGIAFRFFFSNFRSVAGNISTCSRLYPGAGRFDQLTEYCRKLNQRIKITDGDLLQKLVNLRLAHIDDSGFTQINTGRIHLMHAASSMLSGDALKQHIVMLINFAAPDVHPSSCIEIIDDLTGLSRIQLTEVMSEGFKSTLERYDLPHRSTTIEGSLDGVSSETVLLFRIRQHSNAQRVIFILSDILSSSTHRLLKKIAKKEQHILIFMFTNNKGLRKYADKDAAVIVFKDCRPVITSAGSLLTTNEIDSSDDEDEMFDEM